MSPEQANFLEQLYSDRFHALQGYAFHLTHDWSKAEVAVQDAFCVAAGKIDAVMSSDAPYLWMKAAVKNTVRNMQKHESYQRTLILYLEELDKAPATTAPFGGVDVWDLCEKTVGKEHFQLFKQIALDGTSYQDAAKERGIGMWACRKRVQRTTEALQKELQKYFG